MQNGARGKAFSAKHKTPHSHACHTNYKPQSVPPHKHKNVPITCDCRAKELFKKKAIHVRFGEKFWVGTLILLLRGGGPLVRGAAIGQVRNRNFRSSRACPTAFLVHSVVNAGLWPVACCIVPKFQSLPPWLGSRHWVQGFIALGHSTVLRNGGGGVGTLLTNISRATIAW